MLARSAFSIQACVQSYPALGKRDDSRVARSSFRNAFDRCGARQESGLAHFCSRGREPRSLKDQRDTASVCLFRLRLFAYSIHSRSDRLAARSPTKGKSSPRRARMRRGTRPGNHSGSRGWCRSRLSAIPSACAANTVTVDSSAPNNHFSAGPHGSMRRSGARCARQAGSCPIVAGWIVSPARIKIASWKSCPGPAPDDHFVARPDCGVRRSGCRCVCDGGRCPTV